MIKLLKGLGATALSGALAATLAFVLFAVVSGESLLPISSTDARVLFGISLFAGTVSLVGVLIVLLPLGLLLRRYRAEGALAYLLSGLLGGALLSFMLFMPIPFNYANISYSILAIGSFTGAMSGLAWWLFYRSSLAKLDFQCADEKG